MQVFPDQLGRVNGITVSIALMHRMMSMVRVVNEQLALLVGEVSGTEAVIEDLPLVEDCSGSADLFELRWVSLTRTLASGGGLTRLVGLFHTHPHSDPVPSPTDLQFIKAAPWIWAIGGTSASGDTRIIAVAYRNSAVRRISLTVKG